MVSRLLPGVAVAVLFAVCCGAEDLSERVLFSGTGDASPEMEKNKFIPDVSEFGFDVALEDAGSDKPAPAEPAGAGAERAHADMAPPEAPAGEFPEPVATGFAIPSGDLPPLFLEAGADGGAAVSLPARRNLRVWGRGGMLRRRQSPSLLDASAYSLSGTEYSVGLDFDWSVDTTFGLSLGMLDATVKSGHSYDARRSDIRGVFAGASVDSVLFDSYLVGLKGFYGRLDGTGEGSLASPDDGGATTGSWRAAKHRSGMYGLSASVRVPVQFGDYRVVFDSGVSYTRIGTGAYSYRIDPFGGRDSSGEGFVSESFSLPGGVSVERDFVTPRALFTPRLGAGTSYEFSDTAGGVRSLHALSAMPVHLRPGGFPDVPGSFFSAVELVHHVSLGLDVATANGWKMRVDYRRDFAGGYSGDAFSAELGRSF